MGHDGDRAEHLINIPLKLLGSPEVESASGAGPERDFPHRQHVYYLDVTTVGSPEGTLDVDIEGYDHTSKQWYVIASFAQITTTIGTERLQPGAQVPDSPIRAAWAITGGGFTFTVGCTAKD